MADDPVTWLADQIAAGIVLREEFRSLRTGASVAEWVKHQLQWEDELSNGIKARSPRDVARVQILDAVMPQELPADHPWAKSLVSSTAISSTGADCPGSNPFTCHLARIKQAQEIEREWRAAIPGKPKLSKAVNNARFSEFRSWYGARAAEFAREGRRSSREQDREDASTHFGFEIPWDWITEERSALSANHPFHKVGRMAGACCS